MYRRQFRLQHLATAAALLVPGHLIACGSDAPSYTDDTAGGASAGGADAGGSSAGGQSVGGGSVGGGGSAATQLAVAIVRVETSAVSSGTTSVANCPAGHKIISCESSVEGSGTWSTSWTHIGVDASGNRSINCDVLTGESSVRGAVIGNWGKLKFKMRAVCVQNDEVSLVRAATPAFSSGSSAVATCPANHRVVACESFSDSYGEWVSSWTHVGKDKDGERDLSCNVQAGEAGVQGAVSGNWNGQNFRVRAVCLETDEDDFIKRFESTSFSTGPSDNVSCDKDYRMISAEHYGSAAKTWAASWTHVGEDVLGTRALNMDIDATLGSLNGELIGNWGGETFKIRGVCVKKTFSRLQPPRLGG